MKKNWITLAVIIIWLVPVIYLATIYSSLPQQVPLHFDTTGKPNRYGDKIEMCWLILIMSCLSLGMYFLITLLPRIDPKKTAGYAGGTFRKIAFVLVVFLAAIQCVILNTSVTGNLASNRFIFPLIGLLFTALGNFMYNIKPNYFVGIRTPWTLESEDTWRATHHIGGKMWFWGGIVIAAICLQIPFTAAFAVFIGVTVIITLVPVVYSYRYFKKQVRTKNPSQGF